MYITKDELKDEVSAVLFRNEMKIKLKKAIIVTTDLEMGKGKLAAQVDQATENRLHMPEWYNEWLYGESVQTKIILKANNEVKLQLLKLFHRE